VEAKSTAPLDYLQPGASNGVSSTTYSVPPSIILIKKKELLNGTKEKKLNLSSKFAWFNVNDWAYGGCADSNQECGAD
jgi:hypothetical protein